MNPNTTGGIYPAACSHGMMWSLPCAACGRPYQPPAVIEIRPGALADVAEAIREVARAIERHTDRSGKR